MVIISFENQKECPVCEKIYSSDDNFCSEHSKLVELVYTKDLIKICPECGRKYPEDHNFCSKHSKLINLVYIEDLVKVCTECEAEYPEDYNYCVRCDSGEPLTYINVTRIKDIKTHPNQFYVFKGYSNKFEEVSQLLSSENISKLDNFYLEKTQFDDILENIKSTYKEILNGIIEEYHIDFNSLKPLDKILLFSKSFVKTEYKEGGGDLGHFLFNEIYIDDRATDALQITTILHELSHFLLAEILEQILSVILNTQKTDAIEAFVCYILANDSFNYLVDEYCAHTVEGRYALLGYQDYGSYIQALKNFKKEHNEEYIDVAAGIGNTFACYIKDIMSSFIDGNLREEIKEEFLKINDSPKFSELQYETSEKYEWERFSKAIQLIIIRPLDNLLENEIGKLEEYTVKFKKNNW